MEPERVAILGSGPAGATIYRLLKNKPNIEATIYGRRETTACGLSSCAWGINRPKFEEICTRLDLDPKRYYTNHCSHFFLGKLKFKCDLVMVDKGLLLQDLIGDNISYEEPEASKYDRLIDARGCTSTTYHATFQIKTKEELPLSTRIGFSPYPYCIWSFPLSRDVAHVGILSFSNRIEGLEHKLDKYKPICKCYSKVHCGGLRFPLVSNTIWRVGESAGAIDPITGSGILTSMTSSILLSENWNNPRNYEKAMRSRLGYTTNKLKALFHNEFRGLPISLKGV